MRKNITTLITIHRTCTGCGNTLRIVMPRSQSGAAFLPEMHRVLRCPTCGSPILTQVIEGSANEEEESALNGRSESTRAGALPAPPHTDY
jgi:DNA-directed RNA polymerase subunit RPC12/RpoP